MTNILLTPRQSIVYEIVDMIHHKNTYDQVTLGWQYTIYELISRFCEGLIDIEKLHLNPQEIENTCKGWGFYTIPLLKKVINYLSDSPNLKSKYKEMVISEDKFNIAKKTDTFFQLY